MFFLIFNQSISPPIFRDVIVLPQLPGPCEGDALLQHKKMQTPSIKKIKINSKKKIISIAGGGQGNLAIDIGGEDGDRTIGLGHGDLDSNNGFVGTCVGESEGHNAHSLSQFRGVKQLLNHRLPIAINNWVGW